MSYDECVERKYRFAWNKILLRQVLNAFSVH